MITAAEARELTLAPSPELVCDAWLRQAAPWLEGEIRRHALAGHMHLSIGYQVDASTWTHAEDWAGWLEARLEGYKVAVNAGLTEAGPEFTITLSWAE